MDEWATVVEPMPQIAADEQLRNWLDGEAAEGRKHEIEDIRKDIIYSEHRKHLVRYCLRTKVLSGDS